MFKMSANHDSMVEQDYTTAEALIGFHTELQAARPRIDPETIRELMRMAGDVVINQGLVFATPDDGDAGEPGPVDEPATAGGV